MDGIKYRKIEDMKANTGDWFGQIPIEWEKCRIKDYFSDISERNYLSNATLLSLYTDFGIRRTEDITNLRGNKSQTVLEYKKVKIDDIVVNKMLAWMGASGRSNYDGVVSAAYSVYRLKNKNAEIRLFHYMFRDKRFAGECFKNGWGIMLMRWTVTPERFRSIYIPVPKLNQQQKIANFLDIKTAQFDSIIAKKELLIQKLEEAKKSLISEVVTGKVKIIDGEMVPRQPEEMKDSGVEWLGMIPMDWELKKLKYIMKINPVKSEIKRSNQLCSFVPMNKLHNGIIETDEDKRISDVYDGYTYFRDGDIIMAKVTPCFENGDIAIAVNLTNHIGFGTTEINVFRVSEVFDKKYIYYTLQENHFMCYGASHMTGVAGLKRIPTSYFANFMIAMPDFHEQQQLSAYIEGKIAIIRTISNKIRLEIQKIQQAKQSLISEAVTGKIDLRDWEITEVGEAQ